MSSGMPILPTSWRSAADPQVCPHLLRQAQPLGDVHRVGGDVLGVELRVVVLAVDRQDEALQHVERRVRRPRIVGPCVGDGDPVAAALLRVAERLVDRGHELGDAACMEREVRDPDADGDRQQLALGQLEVARLEPRPGRDGRPPAGHEPPRRRDREELVGPEPGEDPPLASGRNAAATVRSAWSPAA